MDAVSQLACLAAAAMACLVLAFGDYGYDGTRERRITAGCGTSVLWAAVLLVAAVLFHLTRTQRY